MQLIVFIKTMERADNGIISMIIARNDNLQNYHVRVMSGTLGNKRKRQKDRGTLCVTVDVL